MGINYLIGILAMVASSGCSFVVDFTPPDGGFATDANVADADNNNNDTGFDSGTSETGTDGDIYSDADTAVNLQTLVPRLARPANNSTRPDAIDHFFSLARETGNNLPEGTELVGHDICVSRNAFTSNDDSQCNVLERANIENPYLRLEAETMFGIRDIFWRARNVFRQGVTEIRSNWTESRQIQISRTVRSIGGYGCEDAETDLRTPEGQTSPECISAGNSCNDTHISYTIGEYGLCFNGSTSSLIFPMPDSVGDPVEISIEGVIILTGTSESVFMDWIDESAGPDTNGFEIGFTRPLHEEFGMFLSNNGNLTDNFGIIPQNTEVHFILVNMNGAQRLYLNGDPTPIAQANESNIIGNNLDFIIGATQVNGFDIFAAHTSMFLDSLEFYQGAIDQDLDFIVERNCIIRSMARPSVPILNACYEIR